jgi:Protein of unknown function (DUF3570)
VEGRDWASGAGTTPLANASADPRLAAFSSLTLGLKFGMPMGQGRELSLRVESYRQSFKKPADAPGALQALELAPTLKATTLMVGYAFPF